MTRSHFMMTFAGVLIAGCTKNPAPPTLPPTHAITAQLHSAPDWGIEGIEHVEVPQEQVSAFVKLVLPVKFIKSGIHPKIHRHVADVYLRHEDSTVTKIEVRETGHNPAAVTTDGVNYFYASPDGPAAGAHAVAVLLTKFHHDKQRQK